ncbi:MAG TPA: BON domain-containing protein [Pyrinomonadaceae bacterium]|nr:BON domain-containing protein [Pyrinomonadaceae bacterium]
MKRLTTLLAALALAALAAACGGETTENRTTNTTTTTNASNGNVTTTTNTTNTTVTANRGAYNANISQEDYEKDKETFTQKAKDAGDKIGTAASDGWLWVKTRGALLAADDLEESGINVDVNNGVITLRGTVPSQDQVKKADAAAKSAGGKSVQNQLKVGAGDANANRTSNANSK